LFELFPVLFIYVQYVLFSIPEACIVGHRALSENENNPKNRAEMDGIIIFAPQPTV
jgi:hypothetical protein